MAIQQEKHEKLSRIECRVKQGEPLTRALLSEGGNECKIWFYRLERSERAPIIRAQAEYLERQRQESRARSVRSHHPPGTLQLLVELPAEKKVAFRNHCEELGVSMAKRISTLITHDMNASRNTFM